MLKDIPPDPAKLMLFIKLCNHDISDEDFKAALTLLFKGHNGKEAVQIFEELLRCPLLNHPPLLKKLADLLHNRSGINKVEFIGALRETLSWRYALNWDIIGECLPFVDAGCNRSEIRSRMHLVEAINDLSCGSSSSKQYLMEEITRLYKATSDKRLKEFLVNKIIDEDKSYSFYSAFSNQLQLIDFFKKMQIVPFLDTFTAGMDDACIKRLAEIMTDIVGRYPLCNTAQLLEYARPLLQRYNDVSTLEIIYSLVGICGVRPREVYDNIKAIPIRQPILNFCDTRLIDPIPASVVEQLDRDLPRLQTIQSTSVKQAACLLFSIPLNQESREILYGTIKKIDETFPEDYFHSKYEAMPFIALVAQLPPEKRAPFLATMLTVTEGLNDTDRNLAIRSIAQVPIDQVEDVVQHLPICLRGATGSIISEIVETVLHSDQADRARKALLLFRARPILGPYDPNWADDFKDLSELSQESIDTLIEIHESGVTVSHQILRCINQLSPVSRETAIREVSGLLDSITNISIRQALILPLFNLSPRLSQISQLLAGIDDSPRRAEILQAIGDSPHRMQMAPDQDLIDVQNIASPDHRYRRLLEMFAPHAAGPIWMQDHSAYYLEVAKEDLSERPLEVLDTLCQLFSQGVKGMLRITFLHEEGVDASGLGKELIGRLFRGLKEKLDFKELPNGLYLPQAADQNLSDQEKRALNQLGMLIMFCFNAKREYPTGLIFDRGFFTTLVSLTDDQLNSSFQALLEDEKSYLQLVDIYAKMNSVNEKEAATMERLKTYAAPFTEKSDDKTLRGAFASAALDYDDDFEAKGITIDNIKQHLKEVQEGVRRYIKEDFLIPHLIPYFLPIVEIAKGMKAAPFHSTITWQRVQSLQPNILSDTLQGRLTHALVVEKLDFGEDISQEKQEWIKNWINTLSLKQLQLFVFGLTGAFALGNENLKIRSSPHIYFHTCFNIVELPLDLATSQEMVNDMMKTALAGIDQLKYNRA